MLAPGICVDRMIDARRVGTWYDTVFNQSSAHKYKSWWKPVSLLPAVSFWRVTELERRAYAHMSGCGIWDAICKHSRCSWQANHETTMSAFSWLHHFWKVIFLPPFLPFGLSNLSLCLLSCLSSTLSLSLSWFLFPSFLPSVFFCICIFEMHLYLFVDTFIHFLIYSMHLYIFWCFSHSTWSQSQRAIRDQCRMPGSQIEGWEPQNKRVDIPMIFQPPIQCGDNSREIFEINLCL